MQTYSEEVLLAAQMIMSSFPYRTIEFFCRCYPHMQEQKMMSCKDMAMIYGCTPPAAKKHIDVLTQRRYLNRVHYRAWQINDELVKAS